MRMVPGLPGTGPGTARQRKLGQGREGRKEGKEREGKERACGAERSGPAARMDGWIDGQRREQEPNPIDKPAQANNPPAVIEAAPNPVATAKPMRKQPKKAREWKIWTPPGAYQKKKRTLILIDYTLYFFI